MKILIIGFGLSGKSLYNYLKNKNDEIFIYDENIELENSYNYKRLLNDLPLFDLGIKSPGIKKDSKEYRLILTLCHDVISEIDYSFLKLKTENIIGVTGSNGKTTFCEFLSSFLSLKYKTFLAGNIGIPLIDIVDKVRKDDFVILELSSFQLEDSKYLKLKKAFITSLSPNHLNYYDNVIHYYASKKRIELFSNDVVYLNDYNCNDYNLTPIIGKHNNLYKLVSLDVSLNYGVKLEELLKKEKELKLDKFRLNGPYKVKNFIIINDSKSTSSSASLYAYDTFRNNKIILILGGNHKSDSFNKIKVRDNDIVLIYGASRERIQLEIGGIIFDTLEDIVKYISQIEDNYLILFSPGCDSHDQFDNYIHRGEMFNYLVKQYIGDFNE